MFFYIKASCKDQKILKKFSNFLRKIETFIFVLKYSSKQKKRKFITVLKSPHVNKTAQEQFEFRFYNKQFIINSFKPLTFLFILKKLKNSSFPGLNLKIKIGFNSHEKNINFRKLSNPDNFLLSLNTNQLNVQSLLFQKYVQMFDCYGESFLKNIVRFNKSLKN